MTSIDTEKSASPTPVVEDPHPGSISDGTHPEATEHKQPKSGKADDATQRVSRSDGKPGVKEEETHVHSEAPRHPNKAAYGS